MVLIDHLLADPIHYNVAELALPLGREKQLPREAHLQFYEKEADAL